MNTNSSFFENEKRQFFQKFIIKRENNEPKFKIGIFFRTADLKKTFSKGETTNWSIKLYEITEIIKDTLPSYRLEYLPERYNSALLKKDRVIFERKYESSGKIWDTNGVLALWKP